MQRLSAPTRHELNEAHRKFKWLDIGVPSFRNLLYINKWRTLAWLVLAASSLPLHLFYNSAVFAQISAAEYLAFVVDPSFVDGASFNVTGFEPTQRLNTTEALNWLHSNIQILKNLSTTDCINDYAQQMQTARGHVLAVASPTTEVLNNSLLDSFYSDPSNV